MYIDGAHLFPLSLIISVGVGDSYFMAADGSIWSTKKSKKPIQLFGSLTNSGTYFKFGQYGATHRLEDLQYRAKSHARWLTETGQTAEQKRALGVLKADPVPEVQDVNEAIKARGSIIGRVHKGHLVFGSSPKIHTSAISVKEEMLRLAAKYPGTKFVKLDIAAAVQSGGVTWE